MSEPSVSKRWLSGTSMLTLTSHSSAEMHIKKTPKMDDRMPSVCYRYYHSKSLLNTCGAKDQRLCLEFKHEGELSYPKEKIREFWLKFDQTLSLEQPRNKKRGTSGAKRTLVFKTPPPSSHSLPAESSTTWIGSSRSSSSTNGSEATTVNATDPPVLKVLKTLMERGVDGAAFAIRPNYPLDPKVCTCEEQCCACILFAPQWDARRIEKERKRLLLSPGQDPLPLKPNFSVML